MSQEPQLRAGMVTCACPPLAKPNHMVVDCLLYIHREKHSITIKQQRQKYKHRDTKIEFCTCH